MMVTWEPADIVCGRVLQKNDCGVTGTFIISYFGEGLDRRYGITSLADGLFLDMGATKDGLCHALNTKLTYLMPAELCGGWSIELYQEGRLNVTHRNAA